MTFDLLNITLIGVMSEPSRFTSFTKVTFVILTFDLVNTTSIGVMYTPIPHVKYETSGIKSSQNNARNLFVPLTDRQTDRQSDISKTICRTSLKWGEIII